MDGVRRGHAKEDEICRIRRQPEDHELRKQVVIMAVTADDLLQEAT